VPDIGRRSLPYGCSRPFERSLNSQPASCIKSALFFKEAAHIPRELQVTLVFVDFTHGEVHRTVKKARSRHFHA